MTEPLPLGKLSIDERQLLVEAVTEYNDDLVTQYINISGQAFGNAFLLGAFIFGIPVVISMVALFFTDRLDLVSFLVCAGMGGLLAAVFANIISNRAKVLSMREADPVDILGRIDSYLVRTGYTWEQFAAMAGEVLAQEAPLHAYLAKRDQASTPDVILKQSDEETHGKKDDTSI